MESVPGRLSLFPAGGTGTIPSESTARNRAEHEALAERYKPGALCDKAQGSGDGCRLWHLNVFALTYGLATRSKYDVVKVLFSKFWIIVLQWQQCYSIFAIFAIFAILISHFFFRIFTKNHVSQILQIRVSQGFANTGFSVLGHIARLLASFDVALPSEREKPS